MPKGSLIPGWMRRGAGTAAATLLMPPGAVLSAQETTSHPSVWESPIRYEISFPNAAHHEAEVVVVFPDLEPGPLEIRMSRTSPGRYALHEFAKNVYNVRASGRGGRPVRVVRSDPHQGTVADHGGEVTFTYTLFGDRADGTYVGIDESHAHLNVPGAFAWARGLDARPRERTIHVPPGSGWREDPWRAARRMRRVWTGAMSSQGWMDARCGRWAMYTRSWRPGVPGRRFCWSG
ncbi:MAG: hypothetical protein ACE5GJ_00600 [Gemmatimonadota bacterium]